MLCENNIFIVIMSLQRFILLFVFLYFFFIINFQVNGTLSIAKTRKAQHMRPSTSTAIHNNENVHIRSGSSSSFSDVSLAEHKVLESNPIASKSILKEADNQPLIEKTKSVGFINSVNLRDVSMATHNDVNINPTQDGVFARVRNAMKYVSMAIAGSAIAAGGIVIGREFDNNNNNNTNQTSTSNIITNSHSVITTDTNTIQRARSDFDNIVNDI